MNKIGVCLGGMCPKIENIRYAKQIGFDYVELHLAEIMKQSEKERLRLKKELDKYNISAEVLYAFFDYRLKIVGKNADLRIIKDYICRAMQIAKLFDSKLLVVGSGGSRSYKEGEDDPKEVESQFAEVLRLIEAELPDGIEVVCEPISRIESNLLNTLEESINFIREYRLDRVGTMIDSYHVLIENDKVSNLEKYMNDVCHIHISDNSRNYPQKEEEIRELLQMLKENNYNGRISIEAKSESFVSDSRQAYEKLSGMLR